MALVLLVSQALFGKNLLQTLIGKQLRAAGRRSGSGSTWPGSSSSSLIGVANLYVAYTFSTSTWATFKVFGLTGLMLVFMVAQGFYISRYLKDEEPPPEQPPAPTRPPAAGPRPG